MRQMQNRVWRKATWLMLSASLVAIASEANAQFIGSANQLVIEHGVYTVGARSAAPIFNAQGFMLSPGGNFPTVVAPTIVSQSFLNTVTGSPAFSVLSRTTAPVGNFGGAHTTLFSWVQPNSAWLGFTPGSYVRDVPANGIGSYNVAGGNVIYQNGPIALAGRLGIFFPFTMFAVGPNAYVAGAAFGRFVIKNAAGAPVGGFDLGVITAFDGAGPGSDGVLVYASVPSFWAWAFIPTGPTSVKGFGLAWTNVVIPAGGSLEIAGRITFLADPDSGVDWTDEFNSDPQVVGNLPDFGYMVPEPASLLMLAAGLVGLAYRRRYAQA